MDRDAGAGFLTPVARTLAQTGDAAFLGVLARSLLWSALAFAAFAVAIGWGAARALGEYGWLSWAGPVLGGIAAGLMALFLFLPVATAIASLYAERIASRVERCFYPDLPPAVAAPLAQQVWDALALGARILLWQAVAIMLALALPGLGLLLGWAVSAWAIGRGLFVAVAMRRMSRAEALFLYRHRRPAVLAQGALIAACGLVPLANLLATVLGVAVMVHVLCIGGGATPGRLWAPEPYVRPSRHV